MLKQEVRDRRRGVAAFVLVAGVAISLAVSLDPPHYSTSSLRTADITVDDKIILGSGSAGIYQYTGDPNAHIGAVKGSFAIDTSTPTIWQNTTGSNVWAQAIGSGSGGGGGSAVTPSLTIGQAVTSGTPNLTTLGTSDWIVFSSNTPPNSALQMWRKRDGGRQIERPVWVGTVMSNIASQARAQLVTWTATDNLSQGSAGAGFGTTELAFSAAGTQFGFASSAPSSTVSRTFVIYVANFAETDAVTCTATMVDNEVSPQSVSFTMAGSSDNRTLTTVYKSAQATRVNVICVITAGPNTNLGWLAAWLA